jgi:hypothetical protein
MRRALPLLSLLPLVLSTACFPRASVPDEERQRVARELGGASRFVKVALHVGQFFGDVSKRLASDQPFDELELLESPSGQVVTPPRSDQVLPPGTQVRIARVEFPTGWEIARRVVMTPRYHPWIVLEVAGEPRPVILVLPQELTTFEEVRLELDRWLSTVDPTPALRELPPEQQRAIAAKQLVDDMPPRAVEMAWGYPEKKVIDRPAGTEEWTWPGGRRRASFRDGKLARWSPR